MYFGEHRKVCCLVSNPYIRIHLQSCCYDVKTWLWVYERPYAGGFQLYHPSTYPLEHILNDAIYKNKCCVNQDYCDLYYDLRPTGACYASSSYDFGI